MSKVGNYVRESYDELVHKVSWPTMKELQSSAIVVAVASLIIALIIFAMDIICGAHPGLQHWKGILGFFYDIVLKN